MGKSFLASRKLLRDRELGREHRGGERRRLFLSTQWPKPCLERGRVRGKGPNPSGLAVPWRWGHQGGDTKEQHPAQGIRRCEERGGNHPRRCCERGVFPICLKPILKRNHRNAGGLPSRFTPFANQNIPRSSWHRRGALCGARALVRSDAERQEPPAWCARVPAPIPMDLPSQCNQFEQKRSNFLFYFLFFLILGFFFVCSPQGSSSHRHQERSSHRLHPSAHDPARRPRPAMTTAGDEQGKMLWHSWESKPNVR